MRALRPVCLCRVSQNVISELADLELKRQEERLSACSTPRLICCRIASLLSGQNGTAANNSLLPFGPSPLLSESHPCIVLSIIGYAGTDAYLVTFRFFLFYWSLENPLSALSSCTSSDPSTHLSRISRSRFITFMRAFCAISSQAAAHLVHRHQL